MIDTESFACQLYEAAAVPERWVSALDDFAGAIGACGAVLIVANGTDFLRVIPSSPAMGKFADEYPRLYPDNPRVVGLVAKGQNGFIQETDISPTGEIILDHSYREYLIPNGCGTGLATVISPPSGENLIVHAEFRYTGQPLSADIMTRVNQLRPHFARAALLSSRLGMERARGMVDTLKALGLPGAVLRGNGSVVLGNTLFDALVPAVLQDRRSRITFVARSAERLFADTLARFQSGLTMHSSASIAVPAAGDQPAMVAHLMPVQGAAHDIFSDAAMLLVVTPIDRAAVPTAEVLQGLFDLTPAEARVARKIAEAQSIADVALSQDVSRETVRTQLKSVLAKTGLHRQSELVRLLAGSSLVG